MAPFTSIFLISANSASLFGLPILGSEKGKNPSERVGTARNAILRPVPTISKMKRFSVTSLQAGANSKSLAPTRSCRLMARVGLGLVAPAPSPFLAPKLLPQVLRLLSLGFWGGLCWRSHVVGRTPSALAPTL